MPNLRNISHCAKYFAQRRNCATRNKTDSNNLCPTCATNAQLTNTHVSNAQLAQDIALQRNMCTITHHTQLFCSNFPGFNFLCHVDENYYQMNQLCSFFRNEVICETNWLKC